MKRYPAGILLAMLALATGGCASGRLDRSFTADEYLEVVRGFEADTTLHVQERALYEAGIAYALPESPAYSPERAMSIFDRLISLYPDSPYAVHAAHLQQLHRELRQNEEAQARLDREVAEREAALAAALAEVEALREELATERARADGMQATVDRLNMELGRANARLRTIEAELEALKGIDLNRPRS